MPIRLPSGESEPEPDIAWVVRGNYSRKHPGGDAVLLLIEVADSSLADDLGEKAALYAAAGIRDYWVVDLINHRVLVHREPGDNRYQSIQSLSGNEAIRPLAIPEVEFRPAELWKPAA